MNIENSHYILPNDFRSQIAIDQTGGEDIICVVLAIDRRPIIASRESPQPWTHVIMDKPTVTETKEGGGASTEKTQAQDERVTTTAETSSHPAIVEPVKSVNHPVIHLYTSLSAGSSYVRPCNHTDIGEYGATSDRGDLESSSDHIRNY